MCEYFYGHVAPVSIALFYILSETAAENIGENVKFKVIQISRARTFCVLVSSNIKTAFFIKWSRDGFAEIIGREFEGGEFKNEGKSENFSGFSVFQRAHL